MRIGILSQWYAPEPGPAALVAVAARALAERGHDVHVLTGFPNYPNGKMAPGYHQTLLMREELDGVHVTRVPLYPSHDQSAARRISNYASFGVSAALLGAPAMPRLDVLWVNYSPITTGLPMWALQFLQGVPTVCEVVDLWPDTMDVAGLRGTGIVRRTTRGLPDRWCQAMYASSDAVVYISPRVGTMLADRGVHRARLHYIPKSADESVFRPGGASMRDELGISPDAMVLSYAGAMGTAQGLDSLIDACALIDDPRLVVLLAGSGTRENELREKAADLGQSDRIRFLGRLPQERMTDFLATSNLAYVSLADHPLSWATMPSKTQSTLSAGRPILAATHGDSAELVQSHGVGFTAHPGDPRTIADAIRSALEAGNGALESMGAAARALYLSKFSVRHTTDQMEALMTAIAGRRRTIPRLPSLPGSRRP